MECTFYAHTNCPEVYEEHGSDLRKTDFYCRDDKIINNEIGEAMITTIHSVIRKACAAAICLQLCVS